MRSNSIVEFKDVSKRYFLGEYSVRTLREGIDHLLTGIVSHHRGSRKEILAVRHINFSLKKGESVGLIGPNGSGKTTIFKLMSRITMPTKGKILVNGRIGSVIDLGAGFHSLLTGLENVYLNAVIRGMRRREVKKRIGEILEFAEIDERFQNTPIKHYSAGMKVRLGFAVSVFCPADIFLVDEVLAVADISFQKKCLEKIRDLQKIGKTILFVSHDTDKVKEICQRVLYLSKGRIIVDTSSKEAIDRYFQDITKT